MVICWEKLEFIITVYNKQIKREPDGQASPRSHHVPQTNRYLCRETLREVLGKVCDMRLPCAADCAGQDLRWVQLWFQPESMHHLQRARGIRCILLQVVHTAGERSWRLPEDNKLRGGTRGPVLLEEKIRIQPQDLTTLLLSPNSYHALIVPIRY